MKVAVALIPDQMGRILVTQRAKHLAHGGLWEFPGGKLEAIESPEEALVREVHEEIGIDVIEYEFLGEISYQYPSHFVQLYVFYITQYQGQPRRMEGQINMKWTEKSQLIPEHFPEANHLIFDLIPEAMAL